jgi:hypothetical protein
MGLTAVNREEVLAGCRATLGLVPRTSDALDNAFLASMLRHTAGFLCPCSGATLRAAALESLQHLTDDSEIVSKVEDAVDGLIVGGDLLELSQVTTDDPEAKATWLFAAPPSFIVRPSGSIFLTGVVADRDTYLPQELMDRIHYDGYTRAIMPLENEDLIETLAALGLQELKQDNWLRAPKQQTARAFRDQLVTKLNAQPRSGDIPDLVILDTSRPVTHYRGRWATAKKQTGTFVARRPQEYGSPIWCLVALQDGLPIKLLDLPLPKSRWRGCDEAWRLQMAIDSSNGAPQVYTKRIDGQYVYVDFYSPLPSWAEKRLMIFGRHADANGCLLSFRVPLNELAAEEDFLKKHLWLSPKAESESRGR